MKLIKIAGIKQLAKLFKNLLPLDVEFKFYYAIFIKGKIVLLGTIA